MLGTSTSGIAAGEEAAATLAREGRMPAHYHYRQQEIGTAAEFAARYLALTGYRYTISTACSSSAKAFASAARLLDAGRCDAAIVGGVDSLVPADVERLRCARVPCAGSLQSVQRQPARHQHRRRRVRVRRLAAAGRRFGSAGVGESSDGYHISAPDPTGRGAEAAIRAALAHAGAAPSDVGYVNLHGTATPKNDEMESEVMARVFGLDVPCSSTKSLIGHTLGAAGAQELGLCWLLLGAANVGRRLAGPRLGRRPRSQAAADQSRRRDAQWERDLFVSNSFAFGGSNAAIAIGRA